VTLTPATGYLYDERHQLHTHPQAPDSAARLVGLMRGLEETGELEPLARLPVELIPWDWVSAAHTLSHVQSVRRLAAEGKCRISFDTYLTPAAPEAALLGASSAVCATRAVLEGTVQNAFSLMRPCGHHALSTRAMGYCIFNNVAIAAHYALREHGLKRVMILDIDAHHGNGTEEIFYGSSDVLFVSLHQHPWFPGTGDWYRNGVEAGLGYNYNVALPTSTGDAGYLQVLDELVAPLAERYRPEIILVSAGFDAHWLDPSSVLGLSVSGYYRLIAGFRALAERCCQGRMVLVLEGGYNLRALTACTAGALRALRGAPAPLDTIGPCPDKPVAPVDGALAPLKGFMRDLMRPFDSPGFFDQAVEVPYEVR
jgi:acetoin utilization deacetylase AcuC-like enzyme